MKNLFIIILISLFFTGCSKNEDIIIKQQQTYLQKYGFSDNNITFKIKQKKIDNKEYILIEKKDFKKILIYIKDLKNNLKKYEIQVDNINKGYENGK